MSKQFYDDDAFYVEQKKYGLWQSHYPDGGGIITSLTEGECVRATRFMLKFYQENKLKSTNEEESVSRYSGSMDYKL